MQSFGDDILDEAAKILEKLLNGSMTTEEVSKQPVLLKLELKVKEHKDKCTSRTAKVWFQYMDMLKILRMAITAERTGDFQLH